MLDTLVPRELLGNWSDTSIPRWQGPNTEGLKDVGLLEIGRLRETWTAADTCLERSHRGNGAKLCSVEMARTRKVNRHRSCLGSFKLGISQRKVTRKLVAQRSSRLSTQGSS